MKTNRLMTFILSLSFVMILAGLGFTEQKAQEQTPQGQSPESHPVLIIGRIEFLQSEGGYFIRGDHPVGVFRIENQNPQVLEKFSKIHANVKIEGHRNPGTNLLFIEKIDGQPYSH